MPAVNPDIVVPAPVPDLAPGFTIHVPEGSPLMTTLPVETLQVGCVITPVMGAAGVIGCGLITTLIDAGDTHPSELVTV